MTIYFEDVSQGFELPELVKGPLTEVDFVRYAGASGDFNPIHFIVSDALAAGLENVIAQGMLIMACAGQMLTNWAGAGCVQRFKVRFSGMTLPNEIVVCRGHITKMIVEGGKHLVSGRLTVKGVEDESLKLKGEFTLRLPSRGA